MEEQNIRMTIDRHCAASAAGDQVAEHEIYHGVRVFTSGEEIRGRSNLQALRSHRRRAVECAVLSASLEAGQASNSLRNSGHYRRSNACKPRGGPKISRRRIASRKPDFDTSKVAIFIVKSARLATV